MLLAVLLMGFVLISSVSAMDIDEAGSSDDISDSGVVLESGADAGAYGSSNADVDSANQLSSNDTAGNVNSESEVLSTDTNENSLESDIIDKDSKNVLSSSSLQAAAKKKTVIKGSGTSITRGSSYYITLTDSNGNVLSNQKVTFSIKGKTYNKTTNSKGVASLKISLAKGKYDFVCAYAGTGAYYSSKLSVSLTVNAMATNIRTSGNSIKRGKSYSITLTDANSNLLANEKVSFNISGHVYNRTTNSKGVASLTMNTAAKKYSLVCSYGGSSYYKASSVALTLTVLKGDTHIKISTDTVKKGNAVVMTLLDVRNKVLSAQKVSFTIKGKTYNLTTNSNGTAKLIINLAAGKYPLVCSYDGSSNFMASKASENLTVTDTVKTFSIADIETAATNLKAYVLKNKVLPSTVTVGGASLKISEFSYLMAKAVTNLNSNNKNKITLITGISNGNSATYVLNAKVYKNQYVNVSKRVYSYIDSNKVPATYATVYSSSGANVGKAGFNLYTFAFAKILAFHKTENYLPNYCTFESSALKASTAAAGGSSSTSTANNQSKLKTTSLKAQSTSITRGDSYSVTLKDGSGNALPNQKITFTVSNKQYSDTTDSKGIAYLGADLLSGKYSITASFAGSSAYKSSKLSNTVTVKNSSTRFFLDDIENAAVNVKNYVSKNKALPTTVTVANTKLTIAQFSYIMAKAVHNINAGNKKYISLISISNCKSSGNYLDTTVYKAQYMNLTNRVISFTESNKVPPVYATVYGTNGKSVGNSEFNLYTFAFAKILAFHKTNNYLPNYCTFQSSAIGVKKPSSTTTTVVVNGPIKANSSQFKTGLNEKNTVGNLSAYLVDSGYSKITSSIQNLANQLTKNLNSTASKALAIYNYVRDEISYSYYANSRYGASGTLSVGSGNCVDQANLIVSLCRASGIYARYSHAQGCTFSSGLVTGHVWAQIYVNGVWYSADATSVRNSLGNIVNWNTNSYYSLKQYTAVPF